MINRFSILSLAAAFVVLVMVEASHAAGHEATGLDRTPNLFRVARPTTGPAPGALGAVAKPARPRICPDAALARISIGEDTAALQLASPSCPPALRVGWVSAAAGAVADLPRGP